MKKSLLTFLFAGALLGLTNNTNAQGVKTVNPKEMKCIEISQSNESYEARLDKIKSIKNTDYEGMISEVKDPRDAKIYLLKYLTKNTNPFINVDEKLYGNEDYWASFKESFMKNGGDCDCGTIAAAALLYDNGFHPYFLELLGDLGGHIVFVYKNKDKKFGALGIYDHDCIEPKYKSIKSLYKKINKGFEIGFNSYVIFDAQDIFPEAINREGNYNLYKIDKLLRYKDKNCKRGNKQKWKQ